MEAGKKNESGTEKGAGKIEKRETKYEESHKWRQEIVLSHNREIDFLSSRNIFTRSLEISRCHFVRLIPA